MKKYRSLIIWIVVLLFISFGCLIGGCASLIMGIRQSVDNGFLDEIRNNPYISDIFEIIDEVSYEFTESVDHSEYVDVSVEDSVPSFEGLESIEIEDMPFDITIQVSDTDAFSYSFSGSCPQSAVEKGLITVSVDDDSIEIKSSVSKLWSADSASLTVTIPSSFAGALSIEDSAGEVIISSDLSLTVLTFDSFAGKISCNGIQADILEIENAASDCYISGSFKGYRIKNCAASIVIDSDVELLFESSIKNCAGRIEIELPSTSLVCLETQNQLGSATIRGGESSSDGVDFSVENTVGEVIIDLTD